MFTYNYDKKQVAKYTPTVSIASTEAGLVEQRGTIINPILREWTLTFANRSKDTADNILNYFETRYGHVLFEWTEPEGSTIVKVYCPTWSMTYVSDAFRTVTAVFREVIL